eukprot:8116660-Lingulodinium_polyedra.AAC.1
MGDSHHWQGASATSLPQVRHCLLSPRAVLGTPGRAAVSCNAAHATLGTAETQRAAGQGSA